MGHVMTRFKPFEIISTREESEGTGVSFKVSKSSFEGNRIEVESIESFVLVPKGEDVDAFLLAYLRTAGWVA